MTIDKKKFCPLILPPPTEHLNDNLILTSLPAIVVAELGSFSEQGEGEFGPRILVGLKGDTTDHVFNLTTMKEYFGSGGLFHSWVFKDISYALTKSSLLEEDAAVVGYASLSPQELETLKSWFSIFLCRFEIVATLI
ncbi:hypothetical protein B0H14DRAFT_3881678 [Mycena olivaceomarginata]|nr:hypothetical protein B0H14DRAFT_3881678 [Mycena olivaceomarginata]